MIYPPDRGGSGAPIYTNSLLNSLVDEGRSTGIICSTHDSYQPGDLRFPVHAVRFANPPIFDSQPKIPGSIAFKDMDRRMVNEYLERLDQHHREVIAEYGYDMLHVQHGMYLGYIAARLRKEFAIPYVVSLHAMELNFLPEFPDPLMAMASMTSADRILALTESQKQRLMRIYSRENIIELEAQQRGIPLSMAEGLYDQFLGFEDLDEDRIQVVPLGIDTKQFNIRPELPAPEELRRLQIPEDASIVLFAGRLLEMKGIRHLLNAEPEYNSSGKVHTIILGGGPLQALVEETARNRRNVHYLGFKEQEEMPAFYNFAAGHDHAIFTVPSSSEGMSLSYIEAMACGLRVLACCTRDMGDLSFMQEPYARFTAFGDPAGLAGVISEMLCDRSLSREQIRSAISEHDHGLMTRRIMKIYDEVALGREIPALPSLPSAEQLRTLENGRERPMEH